MIYCSAWGYMNGNIDTIYRATDNALNKCELKYPYAYFYNMNVNNLDDFKNSRMYLKYN